MFNILLDRMPDEYEGYLIRTDYRIGIQISQALEDEELSPYERVGVAINLLFGEGMPEYKVAYEALKWFMRGGADLEKSEDLEESESESDVRYFSFDIDSSRFYSGFRRMYGIDLDREKIHWFRFLAMMADLGDCAFTQVIGYRTADTNGMDKKTRAAYNQIKKKFALPQPVSEDEQEFMTKLTQ